MSQELKSFLTSLGISTSRTTAYNPQGNGQVEKYNGIVWKTIQLALTSRKMEIRYWEELLQPALHSIRSLLCTATNSTPHERMFTHTRRSFNGRSLPTWLSHPGPVLMRNHVRANKYEPIVQEVELLEANPDYAHVRLPDGRETTVSIRHLAPRGAITSIDEPGDTSDRQLSLPSALQTSESGNELESPPESVLEPHCSSEPPNNLGMTPAEANLQNDTSVRPKRQRRQPHYLEDYLMD